jgi:carbon-monoxide dehydrogenase medium subunit
MMATAAFHKPTSVEEAVAWLAADEEALALAGGATLVAMMNARLVEPASLVSLRAIDELTRTVSEPDGTLRIGAMRRHRETAEETDLRGGQRVLSEAAIQIANPTVRNMGTIGGSISFADPAADYPPALVACDAEVEIAGSAGRRRVRAQDFFVSWYETALAPGELVTAVLIPPTPEGSVGHYKKLARITGDFAIASIALQLAMEDGRCKHFRLAVGGCGPTPVRLATAEAILLGSDLAADSIALFTAEIVKCLDPPDDTRASARYRRLVVPRMIAAALEEARASLAS